MTASGVIEFLLSDGSTLFVEDEDTRRTYEALWDLSNLPGAVSTAAMLLHEANQSARFRRPVELNLAQGSVLRQALADRP